MTSLQERRFSVNYTSLRVREQISKSYFFASSVGTPSWITAFPFRSLVVPCFISSLWNEGMKKKVYAPRNFLSWDFASPLRSHFSLFYANNVCGSYLIRCRRGAAIKFKLPYLHFHCIPYSILPFSESFSHLFRDSTLLVFLLEKKVFCNFPRSEEVSREGCR